MITRRRACLRPNRALADVDRGNAGKGTGAQNRPAYNSENPAAVTPWPNGVRPSPACTT